MERQMKKANGITLIALVITIIVLLILAGVSLSLIIGENGILNKAMSSVEETKKGAAIEQVSLAWSVCQTDYLLTGQTLSKSSYFSKENLTANLSQGEVIKVSIGEESELVYKIGNVYYKMQVTANGEINAVGEASNTLPIIKEPSTTNLLAKVNANPEEYYGKKVNGYTANEVSDWRIFYADNENVFLITSDYITSEKAVEANNTMIANGAYSVFWENAPEVASTVNILKFSPVTNETTTWTEVYDWRKNGACVSTLLDTTKWKSYLDNVNGKGKGKMAIGSPTLNMWIASWNTKFPNDKIYCNNVRDYGFFVGIENKPTGYSIREEVMLNTEGYKVTERENMFYPHQSSIDSNKCDAYWLASPSAVSPVGIVSIHYSSIIRQ